jgi:propionate CoA-transferase
MAKFITAQEAAKLIPDGASVAVAGMGLSGWAEEVGRAIRDNFKETGHPCNLNLKQGCAMGDWKTRGVTVLGEAGPGLVTQWSAAHIGSAFALNKLVQAGEITCHCLPQGVIINLWREIAAHRPGMLTKVGLGTFVDPRVEGGRMNPETTEDCCELVEFDGEEYLYFKSFPLDVAILRGTVADENGNITFDHESVMNEGLAVASAAKNSGGIVIVQVEYLAQRGTLNPKSVQIPGIMVDYVVQATDKDCCWQTEGVYWEPAFSGQIKKPLSQLPVLDLSPRKVICRRCAMELTPDCVANLGVGIPADVASVVAEEGYLDSMTITAEAGGVGGVPAALPNFGSNYNAEAIISHNSMFDFIDGGGLDITVLGLAEADKDGNLNVSKFGNRLSGPGGLIDITQSASTVVFAGTFMAKAKEEIVDGKLKITEEGVAKKFVETVQQITFAGKYARPDQKILYVTERCVLELIDGVMTIIEIAPGADLERDIIANMGFRPAVAADVKEMDASLFCEEWNGLETTLA